MAAGSKAQTTHVPLFCCEVKKAHPLQYDESTPFSSAPLTPKTRCYELYLTLLPIRFFSRWHAAQHFASQQISTRAQFYFIH